MNFWKCPQGKSWFSVVLTKFVSLISRTVFPPGSAQSHTWMPFSGSDGKESARNAENLGSIPGSGRSPEEGNGYPLQYSGLEFHGPYGVTKSWTQLSNFHTSHTSACNANTILLKDATILCQKCFHVYFQFASHTMFKNICIQR